MGRRGKLTDNMMLTQEVRGGVHSVQLHLDPERKTESFTSIPRLTVLRALPGASPRVEKLPMRWTGADSLTAEVPLTGEMTSLATVEIAGQEPVTLSPVCMPYSPEHQPATSQSGLAALEQLARATNGRERVELASIWSELPRLPRVIYLAPWLLLAAVVTLLMEVLERRTGLVSRQQDRLERVAETAAAQGKRIWRRRGAPTTVEPSQKQSEPASPSPRAEPVPEPAAQRAGLVDALRQARQRSRGRMDS
jgi:hypothetical protein